MSVWRRKHRWSLVELQAEWLEPPPHRYGLGIRWHCPKHGGPGHHWLCVFFQNPGDGLASVPVDGCRVAYRDGGPIDELTLTTPFGKSEFDFGGCGRYRIIEGWVELVAPPPGFSKGFG